jgi:hypothetical protein
MGDRSPGSGACSAGRHPLAGLPLRTEARQCASGRGRGRAGPRDVEAAESIGTARDVAAAEIIDAARDVEAVEIIGPARDVEAAENIAPARNIDVAENFEAAENMDAARNIDAARDVDAAENIVGAGRVAAVGGGDVRHSGSSPVRSPARREPRPARAGVPVLQGGEWSTFPHP